MPIRRFKNTCKDCMVPSKENQHQPRLLRGAGLLFLFVFIGGTFALTHFYSSFLRVSDFFAAVLPAVLVDLANDDREEAALGTLTVSPVLTAAAQLKADDMAAKGYFAHYAPDGTSPWHWFREAGYSFTYAGENLAVNFSDSADVNNAWMNSPLHRANILSGNFTEIGIATARGVYKGQSTVFVVQMFGAPAASPATVVATAVPREVRESTLVPATPPEVLGETEDISVDESSFVAVQDTAAEPLPRVAHAQTEAGSEEAATPRAPESSHFVQLLLSPGTLLASAYTLVIVILGVLVVTVSRKGNPYRTRHIFLILLMLAFVSALFYYQSVVMDTVEIASEDSQAEHL